MATPFRRIVTAIHRLVAGSAIAARQSASA